MNRFSMLNTRQRASSAPEIDLTPMLNLIMVVLAFFVLVSMTLTGEPDVVDVDLPGDEEAAANPAEQPPFLAVEIDQYSGLKADSQEIDRDKLLRQIPAYLENNAQSSVLLIPHPEIPYEDVILLLSQMREVGGNRVALAIGAETEETAESETE